MMQKGFTSIIALIVLTIILIFSLGSYFYLSSSKPSEQASSISAPPRDLCDINSDGRCDDLDQNLLKQSLGAKREDPNYNVFADFDADGEITLDDWKMVFPVTEVATPTLICKQRPKCLDSQTKCLMPEPAEGWCVSADSTDKKITGLVLENNLGCRVDVSCYLKIKSEQELLDIVVTYHYGEYPPCKNTISGITETIKKGDQVEILGKVDDVQVGNWLGMSTCDSDKYYIKKI